MTASNDAKVLGPGFISLQVNDLDAAKTFYTEQLGLVPSNDGPPHAVVFQEGAIPFALRTAAVDLSDSKHLGWGLALWLECKQIDSLHRRLEAYGVEIQQPPFDGPFGRTFSIVDPFGYQLTLYGTPG
ncbi:VOC family protein [Saccharospirillum sp. HFRX-1]|uniref:VOC family protein n=1 Tax=unclassified Saccharospirillum TaxID=2633430 RepID=UPI0037113AFB